MSATVFRSSSASTPRLHPYPAPQNAPAAKPERPVAIDGRARCAWSWLAGLAFAQPGTILVGPTGETLRVREDGGVDQVLPGGHPRPSVAADPLNTRRAI